MLLILSYFHHSRLKFSILCLCVGLGFFGNISLKASQQLPRMRLVKNMVVGPCWKCLTVVSLQFSASCRGWNQRGLIAGSISLYLLATWKSSQIWPSCKSLLCACTCSAELVWNPDVISTEDLPSAEHASAHGQENLESPKYEQTAESQWPPNLLLPMALVLGFSLKQHQRGEGREK